MRPKNHNPAARPVSQPASSALTFPAGLVQLQQSQVGLWEGAVGDRVAQLDLRAQQLGAGFGIPLTSWSLNPLSAPASSDGLTVALAMLHGMSHREERVTLERRSGRWGLYFVREPSLVGKEGRSDPILLRDASLDVRERFLLRSDEFFRAYLDLCEDRLGRMRESVGRGDETLRLLDDLRLS